MNSVDKKTLNYYKYHKPSVSFIDKLKHLFKSAPNPGFITVPDVKFLEKLFTIGHHNDQQLIIDGYDKNVVVYAIIDKISTIASLPTWGVYEKVNEKSFQEYKALSQSPYSKEGLFRLQQAKVKALRPIESNEFADRLLNPNPIQSSAEYTKALISFQLITGDLYEYANLSSRGNVLELWVMPSQFVEIKNNGAFPMRETGYELSMGGNILQIPKENVNHCARFNPNYDGNGNHLYGMSPLDAAWINVIQDNEARYAAMEMLKNRGVKGVLFWNGVELSYDKAKEQTGRLVEKWRQIGKEYKDDIPIMFADGKYIPIGLDAKQMAISEICGMNKEDLCAAFGISPILLGDTDASSYNNYITARKDLITSVIMPYLNALASSRTKKLQSGEWGGKRSANLVVDYDQTVYTELYSDLVDLMKALKETEAFTDNEIRAAINWEKSIDPTGDMVWKSSNKRPASVLATAPVTNNSFGNEAEKTF